MVSNRRSLHAQSNPPDAPTRNRTKHVCAPSRNQSVFPVHRQLPTRIFPQQIQPQLLPIPSRLINKNTVLRVSDVCASCFRLIRQAPEPLVVLFAHLAFEQLRSPTQRPIRNIDLDRSALNRVRRDLAVFAGEKQREKQRGEKQRGHSTFRPDVALRRIQKRDRHRVRSQSLF